MTLPQSVWDQLPVVVLFAVMFAYVLERFLKEVDKGRADYIGAIAAERKEFLDALKAEHKEHADAMRSLADEVRAFKRRR